MHVGYIRVSTADQNTGRQQRMMEERGITKVYIDYATGSNTDRPKLKEMMTFVREGDTIVVESISRFARCTKDLLALIEELEAKKVGFKSLKENIDTQTPTGKFMLTVLGAMSQLEREYIRARQAEGIAIAKEKGVYTGRKRKEIQHFEVIYKEWKSKQEPRISDTKACEILGISKSTWYRRVKEYEEQKRNSRGKL